MALFFPPSGVPLLGSPYGGPQGAEMGGAPPGSREERPDRQPALSVQAGASMPGVPRNSK